MDGLDGFPFSTLEGDPISGALCSWWVGLTRRGREKALNEATKMGSSIPDLFKKKLANRVFREKYATQANQDIDEYLARLRQKAEPSKPAELGSVLAKAKLRSEKRRTVRETFFGEKEGKKSTVIRQLDKPGDRKLIL